MKNKEKNNFIKIFYTCMFILFFLCIFSINSDAQEKYGEFYETKDEYITRILPETTLQDLKNNLENQQINVKTENGKVFPNTEYVGTSMKMTVGEKNYTLSVIGDVDGNGKITITDASKINLHKNNLKKLDDKYILSADLNNDGKITITDVVQINLVVVNLKDIIAPVSFTPTVTSTQNSITIEGITTDKNSGIDSYSFKLDNGNWAQNTDKTDGKYTFSSVDSAVGHTVLMKVKDKAGNQKKTKITNIEAKTPTTPPEDPSQPGTTETGYTIFYDPNEGEVTPTKTIANYGEAITMPTPTRKYQIKYNTNGGNEIASKNVSCLFRGWYTQKIDGEKVEYTTMPQMENRSMTVYAHWNTPYITLPTPIKDGYTFDGWYDNESLSGNGYRAGDSYVATQTTTFYAKWK